MRRKKEASKVMCDLKERERRREREREGGRVEGGREGEREGEREGREEYLVRGGLPLATHR